MGQEDIFTGHRITEQGLHIKSEQGEIIIPLDEASKLLSALQRMTNEPSRDDNGRRQGNTSLHLHGGQLTRRMKHG
jgi:hypothetical protein